MLAVSWAIYVIIRIFGYVFPGTDAFIRLFSEELQNGVTNTQGFSWILLCSCGDGADSGIYSGNGEYGEGTEKCIEPQGKKRDTEK